MTAVSRSKSFLSRIKFDKRSQKSAKEKDLLQVSSSGGTQSNLTVRSSVDLGPRSPISPSNSKWKITAMSHTSEGVRHKNEDRFFCKTLALKNSPLQDELYCFAIFDGHGGSLCSEFFAENFERYVQSCTSWYEEELTTEHRMRMAIKETLDQCEKEFCSLSKEQNDTSGTCTVFGFYYDGNLCVGNVGDCLAILYIPALFGDNEKRVELSVPHRSRQPEERARIERTNGHIENFRAYGVLEPSRTIGDVNLKEYRPGGIIIEPHITFIKIPDPPAGYFFQHKIDRPFIVLASDGLWDVVKKSKVFDNSLRSLKKWRKNPDKKNTARHLVRTALRHGTMDDATVIVVHFDA